MAMEFARDIRQDTYAGTPPLKAVRLLIAITASLPGKPGEGERLIGLHDVSGAFYHADLDEDIAVIPPDGEEEDRGVLWQLLKAMYGTRRASFLFQALVIRVLESAGFHRIVITVQVYWHPDGNSLRSVTAGRGAWPTAGKPKHFVDDVLSDEHSRLPRVHLGNVPCQPFSTEGKGLGTEDPTNGAVITGIVAPSTAAAATRASSTASSPRAAASAPEALSLRQPTRVKPEPTREPFQILLRPFFLVLDTRSVDSLRG